MSKLAALAVAAICLATPAMAACVDDVKAVLAGSLDGGPYALELTSDDTTMTAEVVPPGAIHARTSFAGGTQEMTVVGGKGWMQMDGKWTPMPDALANQMSLGIEGAASMIDQIGNTRCLGMQNFEGRDYLVFAYDFASTGVETSSTLYVDPGTRLPAIVVGSSTAGGKTTDTRATYRYDPGITVSAPPLP